MADSRKWRVVYKTPAGGRFVRLLPASYGESPAEVKRAASSPQMLRAIGERAGYDARRAEQLEVVKVERSSFH